MSTSPDEWWYLTENLCRSIAVMSAVGYIIGLGDRHLDNVLLDLHKGEIVHIDYNVCFEKGRNLKVPERVPFRLTQNIQTAMGLTGIEGTFRLTCEQVLTILRKERETLLTLLEAFVYDPLVDWTPLQEAGVPGVIGHQVLLAIYGAGRMAEYRNTSYQLAVRMFAVRLKELERQWMENKSEVEIVIKQLSEFVQDAVEKQEKCKCLRIEIAASNEVLKLVNAALNDPNHNLFSLPVRFKQYGFVKSQIDLAVAALHQQLQFCAECIQSFKTGFDCAQNVDALKKNVRDLMLGESAYALTEDFMKSAGKQQAIDQVLISFFLHFERL